MSLWTPIRPTVIISEEVRPRFGSPLRLRRMDAEDFGVPEFQLLIQNLKQYRSISVAKLLAAEAKADALDAQGSDSAAPGDFQIKARANRSDVAASVDMPMSSVGVPAAELGPAAELAIRTGKIKNAAVLVPMFRTPGGEVRVWLTKRATKLSSHAGAHFELLSLAFAAALPSWVWRGSCNDDDDDENVAADDANVTESGGKDNVIVIIN